MRWRASLGLATLAALLVWLLVRGERAPGGRAEAATAGAEPTLTGQARPAPAPAPAPAPGEEPSIADQLASPAHLRAMLADYRRAAVYPVWSRPHHDGSTDLLEWNTPVVSTLPFDDRPGAGVVYRFGADRAHVMFGETLTAWIELQREGDGVSERVPATVVEAWVMSSGPRPGRRAALTFRDDGQGGDEITGDLRYTTQVTPSSIAGLDGGDSTTLYAVVAAGGVQRALVRDFTFAPRPVLEVLAVRDAARDGSLVITVEVETFEPGLYTFEANLFGAADGHALAFTDHSVRLPAGRSQVELTFFGRIFHDLGVDGPFVVRDLRGQWRSVDETQDNVRWADPREFRTRAYGRADFSPAEWDSPEKRLAIANFETLIAEAEAAAGGGAVPGTR